MQEEANQEENAREKKIKEVEEHNKKFMAIHRLAIQQWYDKHKSTHPGVHKAKDGKLFMANRKQRKSFEKKKKKKNRF